MLSGGIADGRGVGGIDGTIIFLRNHETTKPKNFTKLALQDERVTY